MFLMIIGKGTEYSVISLSIYIYIFFFYENDIHKQRQDKKKQKFTITSCQKYLGATGKKVNEKY